jgi:hypothetical protein
MMRWSEYLPHVLIAAAFIVGVGLTWLSSTHSVVLNPRHVTGEVQLSRRSMLVVAEFENAGDRYRCIVHVTRHKEPGGVWCERPRRGP